jgi:hypothetical protein
MSQEPRERKRGAYIAYSELYDRRPTDNDLLSIVRRLPLQRALILLIRITLSLRFVEQEPGKPNFGKLQQLLAANFCDKDTFSRLMSRFGTADAEQRPIFTIIQCLNLLRLVILESPPLSDEMETDDHVRRDIGTALLMISDLLLKLEELQAIRGGSSDERRLALMGQLLAPFELQNPPSAHRLAIRYQLMHRTVLRTESVRQRIKSICRGLDIEDTFEQITGLSLDRWLHSLFIMHSYYQFSANPWDHRDEFFTIDRDNFVGTSDIGRDELDLILETISDNLKGLSNSLSNDTRTDPRFDFVPFRKKPLAQLSNGRLVCVDSAFLLEQVHVGVHWVMHDRLPREKRNDLFSAWGVLFEEYVNHLFVGMKTDLPIKYFRAPKWTAGPKDSIGQESFDGIFVKDTLLCPMEYKGGFLSRKSRYSTDPNPFIIEMREKFEGPRQLAWKIASLFGEAGEKARAIEYVETSAYEIVLPILILQDHIFSGPFVNWWLNAEFQRELSKYKLRAGVKVEAMNVITIHELEGIVNSVEAANFDFLYVLRLRAIRDPEMRSELPDILFQFPEYGKQKSARSVAAIEAWSKSMFGNLFPGEPLG